MYFVTDTRPGEPDVLSGLENETLRVISMDGVLLVEIKPDLPWTHERLAGLPLRDLAGEMLDDGADAYLGNKWVGSTEV